MRHRAVAPGVTASMAVVVTVKGEAMTEEQVQVEETLATAPNLSWKGEVIADNSGKFCGNALRYRTKEEAEKYVMDLSCRWTLVRETRVVESTDPVTDVFEDGRSRPLDRAKPASEQL